MNHMKTQQQTKRNPPRRRGQQVDPKTGLMVPKSTAKYYFNADTQAAIVAYQQSQDKVAKEKIFLKEILPAFEKLTENLINVYKFSSLHDTYEDLKNDCVNFLFETIGKFDATRGTNAFAYFNVVAKNWLIIKVKQKQQRIKRSVSLDDSGNLNSNDLKMIEDHNFLPSQDEVIEQNSRPTAIIEMMYDIRSSVKTENELLCINSIITIFENAHDLDLINKNAILVYMRELSGLSPKQLTLSLQVIKKTYKQFKLDLQEEEDDF